MNVPRPINPFYQTRRRVNVTRCIAPGYARLPLAPINASPVPHLTSLYHNADPGNYGRRNYPGNCGGNLIADLLRYFRPTRLLDPMTGSGTCADVCDELRILCWSSDLHAGADACSPSAFPAESFDFCWLHPPYWRQKLYTDDPRDLSRTPTLDAFLERYRQLIANCANALDDGGRLAVLMGDYSDRDAGFVPLVYHTKRLAFAAGLRQSCTDIIRFSHGASSSRKVYRSAFIPGLHDVCMIFDKPHEATR
ncbi:MAG: hypothetical protein HC807_07715 [Gammaproteobacteria bacterium]|nr:hypothetical protein [Gammaproteobacteria bacterium]